MNEFPHEGHTGLVWAGLASDTIFDTASLPEHTPMMERLDARTFTTGTYMFEANIGKGRLIATTLRMEGGLGSQPTGIENHPVALYLLNILVSHLSSDATQ